MTNAATKRFENIKKGKYDQRFYRGLELSNGLRAILISDPTTDKSAACLTVNVGAINDFKELDGLAHFLEHALFLGSKKYPYENALFQFVAKHGGSTNASTDEYKTNFFFDIGPEHLTEGLDIFAQFFLEPLFEESAIQREVNAVNSEHEKNIQDDDYRIFQLEKSMAKADHPYNHFLTGNKETLNSIPQSKGINVREQLLNFHNTWYSANIMYLAVLGKESLDELESIVSKLFGEIKNKKVEPVVHENPFGPDQLKRKLYVVPVKDIRLLKISFSAPDIVHQYKTSPARYIGQLISHEGPGSLHSVLRDLGLCTKLGADLYHVAPGFGFFIIEIDLTEEALGCVDTIISLVFQYIKLLKTEGIKKWIFDENSKLGEISFLFKDKESDPFIHVLRLSTAMMHYPFEDILSANYIINEWKPELIVDFLSYLRPDNMRVVVVSKSFEDKADKTEKWYGTKFSVEPIPNEFLEKLNQIELSPVLHLPPPNEFIPEDFKLYPVDDNAPVHPHVIQETALSRIWFKQDDKFKLPKLDLRLELFSPIAYLDPGNFNLTALFVLLLKDSLNEYAYSAQLAGLRWDISPTNNGIALELSGFNEKLPVLLEKIISRMTNFKINPKRFEIIKEMFVRELRNFETAQPFERALTSLLYLLAEFAWTNQEFLSACDILELSKLQKFIPNLFSRMYIQGLIHGNCNKEKSAEIIDIFEAPFKSAICLLPQQLLPSRYMMIENGSQYIYEILNKYHSSSCLCVYFQCSLESPLNNAIIELFAYIFRQPSFDVLRTREQLGYIVVSFSFRVSNVQSLMILVQSEKHPVYLNSRVEEFLNSIKNVFKYEKKSLNSFLSFDSRARKFIHSIKTDDLKNQIIRFYVPTLIESMTDEEFEIHKTALATVKLEKPKQLRMQTVKFWIEIVNRHYNFDRVELELKELRSLQKKHILNFYEELVDKRRNRKLSIHIVSKITNPELPKNVENKETRIEDVTIFKNSLGLFPLPKAYINITPLGTKSKL